MTTEEECSRMHCVDKVRTLLEECLGPPNETAFLNFDRCLENELALSVEELPDQTISFQSFLDRISTFRPQYWGADPNAILQFAKYGWRCSEKFAIKCDVCLSTVECSSLIQKPELWTLVSHKGHEKLCFWTGCPCPDRFTKITINPKIIKKKMALCLKRTAEVGSDLPSISKDVLASMDITSETLDTLFEILDSRQTEETVSALLLAICGWLNGEVDRTMKCGYCQRQILFHNFVSIKDKSEKQSVSESERSAPGDDTDRMEVCDDRAGVSESGQNVGEGEGGNVNPSTQDEVNDSVITTSPSAVDEVESTVLPKLDAACTVEDVANATVGNDSESEKVTVGVKESSEELGNATLEAASDEKPPAKMEGEDQCNKHLEPKINEVAEEPGRIFNGVVSDDGEVGHQGAADVQSSKKRKLEDEERTPEAENLCADDQLNAKKLCLQKSPAVEENGECREAEEVTGKKDSSVSLFNNCHVSVNEKSAVCKTEAEKVDPGQPCKDVTTAVDGSCEGNEVADEKMQISEVKSLNPDSNSVGVAEETPTVTRSDTVGTKLNGDAPAFVSDSVQVPKLNSFKDADVAGVGETDKGHSGVVQSDAGEEDLGDQVNLKPPECEVKVSDSTKPSEPLDVVNHTTPDCEDGGGSSVCAAGLTDDGESAETVHRTPDSEMVAEGDVACGRVENGGGESCETDTEPPSTCKKSGKRKFEDCADDDEEENLKRKREEAAAAAPPTPRKQFHPVEEHRYWCIWKLRTKDRGVQKEGWRQVLDYLKLSPPTPAEQPTPDFYGEVKKLFTLLGDW